MSPIFRTNLFGRFEKVAHSRPDSVAMTFLDAQLTATSLTYAELMDEVERLAQGLASKNLDPSCPLGILISSQRGQVLHYLAALRCGLTPAILTPPTAKQSEQYYLETLERVVENCQFSAIVTDIGAAAAGTPIFAAFSWTTIREALPALGGPIEDAAFLQFSSGTTGIKKGVLISHQAALAQIDTYAKAIGLHDDDVIVSWLPLYHDMGFIIALNMPLACGVPVVMLDPIDWVSNPALYLRAITEYRGTLGWNPNFAYAFMASRVPESELDEIRLESVRGMANCSEPVTRESQDRFATRFAAQGLSSDVFFGCYAMAETTFAVTHGRTSDSNYLDEAGPEDGHTRQGHGSFVSVGKPIDGVVLEVVDDDGRVLAERCIGELRVRSPFNLESYYNNPDATRDAVEDGWYYTGDLGYRVDDSFYVCGRKRDLLITSGVNVYAQDLEDVVSLVEGVLKGRVAAFANFDEALQTDKIVILAEMDLEPSDYPRVLCDARQRIQATFHISHFQLYPVQPGSLIKSSSGKMARRANREKWLAA